MSNKVYTVTVDEAGYFYCRALESRLNYKKDQQVCGYGCPCFVKSGGGRFVCQYEGEDGVPPLFPSVQGLNEKLQRAYAYAANAHHGQRRKGTELPYFSHILTTMNYAVALTDDVEVLTAAILHDTVEDTTVTIEDIRREFGARVSFLVEAQTEDKRHGEPATATWEIRKQETIAYLKDMPRDVKLITLADKTANLEACVREHRQVGDKLWEKFNQTDKKRQEWYFRACAEALAELSDTSVMQKYFTYIEELFGTEQDYGEK